MSFLINLVISTNLVETFFNKNFMMDFLDFFYIFSFTLYKVWYNFLLKFFYYFSKVVLINILKFINTFIAAETVLFLDKVIYKVYKKWKVFNRNIFKLRRRIAMYYRFGKFRSFRDLFYFFLFVILVFIWKKRNLYRRSVVIYSYLRLFIGFMVCTWIFNGFLDNWDLSCLLSIILNFIVIILTLK